MSFDPRQYWPMTSGPIADNESAPLPKWWNRFLSPATQTIDALDNDDTGWLAATLANSWVAFGSGGWPGPFYRRRRGIVYMTGLIASGTGAAAILTLPIGFRPASQVLFHVPANSGISSSLVGAARIDVHTDGTVNHVIYINSGNNGYLSLDNIRFYAETEN